MKKLTLVFLVAMALTMVFSACSPEQGEFDTQLQQPEAAVEADSAVVATVPFTVDHQIHQNFQVFKKPFVGGGQIQLQQPELDKAWMVHLDGAILAAVAADGDTIVVTTTTVGGNGRSGVYAINVVDGSVVWFKQTNNTPGTPSLGVGRDAEWNKISVVAFGDGQNLIVVRLADGIQVLKSSIPASYGVIKNQAFDGQCGDSSAWYALTDKGNAVYITAVEPSTSPSWAVQIMPTTTPLAQLESWARNTGIRVEKEGLLVGGTCVYRLTTSGQVNGSFCGADDNSDTMMFTPISYGANFFVGSPDGSVFMNDGLSVPTPTAVKTIYQPTGWADKISVTDGEKLFVGDWVSKSFTELDSGKLGAPSTEGYTLAVVNDGVLKVWGKNAIGRRDLSRGDTITPVVMGGRVIVPTTGGDVIAVKIPE